MSNAYRLNETAIALGSLRSGASAVPPQWRVYLEKSALLHGQIAHLLAIDTSKTGYSTQRAWRPDTARSSTCRPAVTCHRKSRDGSDFNRSPPKRGLDATWVGANNRPRAEGSSFGHSLQTEGLSNERAQRSLDGSKRFSRYMTPHQALHVIAGSIRVRLAGQIHALAVNAALQILAEDFGGVAAFWSYVERRDISAEDIVALLRGWCGERKELAFAQATGHRFGDVCAAID